MADCEYEEENLDDFMINASLIISQESNPEKETMIESLKQHLSSIFDDKSEMQSFFKTLNNVIFNKNANKIVHKQPFKLYPLIFSFNPNSSFYYIDFFLFSINQSINEENQADFAYLSIIFSEVILSFFSDENNNNLISKEYLLENNKKYKLYEKLLNFCNEKIKTNQKIEQSFGCLILTELIEKCPIVKEDQYLNNIFNIISNYLEDRWFVNKLDLLNCTISLIFTAESKFKPYANICLFKVLDYLTDNDWMKRKLAINIVYTLVFYCKEQIMAVKDNIIDFLNTLKEDSVEEVRDVCLQTLNFIEEKGTEANERTEGDGDDGDNGRTTEENLEVNNQLNQLNNQNQEPAVQSENKKNDNSKKNIIKKVNKNVNKNSNTNLNAHKKIKINNNPKSNVTRGQNKIEINYKSKTDEKVNNDNISKTGNNSTPISNFKINNKTSNRLMLKQKANEDYLRKQILKEKNYLEKIERELNEKEEKSLNNINMNNNQENNIKPKKSNKELNKKIKKISIEPIKKNENIEKNINNQNNPPIKDDINKNQNENDLNNLKNESFKSTLDAILKQLHTIQHGQNEFLIMLNDIQQNIDTNYSNLNERIAALENFYSFNNNNNFSNDELYEMKLDYMENKTITFEDIKSKFMKGFYNEALIESKRNDKNLFKILPLIDKNNITEIRNKILEDIINILNKKLSILSPGNNSTNIKNILLFYMNIVKAKINLKLITTLNLKEALNFFKKKNSEKISKNDLNNIDIILKALKV